MSKKRIKIESPDFSDTETKMTISLNGKDEVSGITMNDLASVSMQISAPKKAAIKIVKVKINEDKLEIHYFQFYEGAKPDKIVVEGGNLMHEDLYDAFARFRPHLAVIKDMKESMIYDEDDAVIGSDDYKLEYFRRLFVTGIVISGEDYQEGFMLIGKKIIGTRVFNELTPLWKFNDEQDPYKFMAELFECIENLNNEVELYLHGKFGVSTTPELPFAPEPEI